MNGCLLAAGVCMMLLRCHRSQRSRQAFDVAALTTAVLVPLGMSAFPDVDGILQRLMFAVAYAWYLTELRSPALRDLASSTRSPASAADQTNRTRSSSP